MSDKKGVIVWTTCRTNSLANILFQIFENYLLDILIIIPSIKYDCGVLYKRTIWNLEDALALNL